MDYLVGTGYNSQAELREINYSNRLLKGHTFRKNLFEHSRKYFTGLFPFKTLKYFFSYSKYGYMHINMHISLYYTFKLYVQNNMHISLYYTSKILRESDQD